MTNTNGDNHRDEQLEQIITALADLRDITRGLVNFDQENCTALANLREITRDLVDANQENREAINQLAINQQVLRDLTQQIALSHINLNENVMPQFVSRMEEMQSEIRGLQTENRRIIDRLFGEDDESQ
ncbi:MAG: hypothetical protein ACFB4I_15370 [Cyanophyceae cyanobacterium]